MCQNSNDSNFNISKIDIIKLNITNSTIIKIMEKMNENKIIHNFTDFSQDYNETEAEEKKANNSAILNKFLIDLSF